MATWTVSTHYKKSCQEVEFWVRREGEGKIITTNGFRYGEWTVDCLLYTSPSPRD